jgi:ABC-2 type transport system permease protein
MSEKQNAKTNGKTARRVNRYRLRSFFLGVLVVCLLLALQGVLYLLPDSVARTDLYPTNITQISAETKDFIGTLDRDVTLYWLCEDGEADGQLQIFLSRYTDADVNDRLTVVVVDPLTNELFSDAYAEDGVGNMSIVVQSDLRSTVVDSSDMYVYTNDYMDSIYNTTVQMSYSELYSFYQQFYSAYGYYPDDTSSHVYFQGENLLTAAIDYVTAEDVPHGYLLSGHGDVQLPTMLQSLLDSYDILPISLDLTSGGTVPADAECLILYAPETDLTEAEESLIQDFVAKGGALLLVTDPTVVANCPRVAALGELFGLTAQAGVVIDQNEDYMYAQSQDQLLPEANQNQYVSYLLSSNSITALFPYAHGISVASALPTGVTATAMLSTSESGNRVANEESQETVDEDGTVHVAVYATKSVTLEDGTTGTAQLTWFGSTQAFEDSVAAEVDYGNDFYVTFSLLTMVPSYSSEFGDMDPLSLSAGTMSDLTEAPAIVWMIVLVLVVPISLLVAGIVIWIKRRSR